MAAILFGFRKFPTIPELNLWASLGRFVNQQIIFLFYKTDKARRYFEKFGF